MSNKSLSTKPNWVDYSNLVVNIQQSIQLGKISNQLSDLSSINSNMLNLMEYQLDKEELELSFNNFVMS